MELVDSVHAYLPIADMLHDRCRAYTDQAAVRIQIKKFKFGIVRVRHDSFIRVWDIALPQAGVLSHTAIHVCLHSRVASFYFAHCLLINQTGELNESLFFYVVSNKII